MQVQCQTTRQMKNKLARASFEPSEQSLHQNLMESDIEIAILSSFGSMPVQTIRSFACCAAMTNAFHLVAHVL